MNLHTRFLITIVSLIIIPIIFLGYIINNTSQRLVLEKTLSQLDMSAGFVKARIVDYYEKNLERLNGVASRTQMRLSLKKYTENQEGGHKAKITKIIKDALKSIHEFEAIYVFDVKGKLVASTLKNLKAHDPLAEFFAQAIQSSFFEVFKEDPDDIHYKKSVIGGPLYLDEEKIGAICIVLNTKFLNNTSNFYSNIGKTEDIAIARENDAGDAEFIFARKFEKEVMAKNTISQDDLHVPITQALLKKEAVFDQVVDYRGKDVLASTRYIPQLQWGVVVKLDYDEFYKPVYDMRKIVFLITAMLVLFSIIMSIIMSKSIVSPIISLTQKAENVSRGDFETNETLGVLKFDDELGRLASSFNVMTDGLVESKKNLEANVEQRTRELEKKISILDRLNKSMVDRELRMKELKQEIEELRNIIKDKHENT